MVVWFLSVRAVGCGTQALRRRLPEPVSRPAMPNNLLCDVYRKAAARYRNEHNTLLEILSWIDSPFEAAVIDVLVRVGPFGQRPVTWFAETHNPVGATGLDATRREVLFTDNSVTYLGRGAEALHTTDYPKYVEMIKYVMDRLGWDAGEFEAYRYRLTYPVMPSTVMVRCDLPEKPT